MRIQTFFCLSNKNIKINKIEWNLVTIKKVPFYILLMVLMVIWKLHTHIKEQIRPDVLYTIHALIFFGSVICEQYNKTSAKR